MMLKCTVMPCLALLSLIGFGNSFQMHCMLGSKTKPVHLLKMQTRAGGNDQSPAKKRTPANKRQAIRWIVQGVERCLAEQQLQSPPNKKRIQYGKSGERIYTYKRREDASLVDALYLLVNAKSQKEVINAGKKIQVLMRVERGRQDFPVEVTERVIKATASTGLVALSLDLLRRMLQSETFPSSMAYIAVLSALRKNGRTVQMEELLTELGSRSRKIHSLRQKSGDLTALGHDVGVEIIAFNTFIAALCDAAVKEIPFSIPSKESDGTDMESFDSKFFSDNNITEVTSPSEKYLYKALNLLRGNTARTRFELLDDPDIYSFNALLAATAKCSRSTASMDFAQSIIEACLREMKQRAIKADAFTYNARIEVALQSETFGSEAMRLVDEAVSDPDIEIDRYTINLALVPFLKAGRRDEAINMLRNFVQSSSNTLISSAFEAFLNTLVKNDELDFATEVFKDFFLAPRRSFNQANRIQLSREIRVMRKDTDTDIMASNLISPTTRHFNVLFAGYSKSYRSLVSQHQRPDFPSSNDPNESDDVAMSLTKRVHSLLDAMLDIGVPLDEFSVSSLMAFPSTPDEITSLWTRIEPELQAELGPAAYRSIMYAYGNANDPSSACWAFFNEVPRACGQQGMGSDSWNVLLGALALGCTGEQRNTVLDPLNSAAAKRNGERSLTDEEYLESNPIFSLVNRKTSLDASISILDAMRNRRSFQSASKTWTAPKPNSQTYCQVATAVSGSGKFDSNATMAYKLFEYAKADSAYIDGRFINAVLRCFGDDIQSALGAWKSGMGSAAAGIGVVAGPSKEQSNIKQVANLAAAYNGLFHVCGRAIRPDIGLRLCYAMKKAGVEPNEVSLNSYYAGKKIAMDGKDAKGMIGLKKQFESLLTVECTKYSTKYKGRASDKKIRIILS